MYTLRKLDGHDISLAFIDIKNAYDTVRREMAIATLRWMGVPEAGVRMV